MRLTEDKEMDLLLGRFARRERGEERPASGSSNGGAHMDADELNAYAENAVSPATRARYAAHLADCDDCRRSVTRLVLATGAASAPEKRTEPVVQTKRSWWQSLSTLFSLPVIRYGVPALAIAAIVSVVFLSTRRATQPDSVLVAENREQAPVSAVSNQPEQSHAEGASTETSGEPSATPSGDVSNTANTNSISGPNPGPAQERAGKSDAIAARNGSPEGPVQQPLADARVAQNLPATKSVVQPLSAPSDALGRTEDAKRAEEPSPPAPASAGSGVAAVPEPRQNMDAPQNEIQNTTGLSSASAQRQARAAREMSRGRDMTLNENGNGAGEENNFILDGAAKTMSKHAPAPTSARRRSGAREDKDESSDKERRVGGESEKRSVAGRTFRRQGSAWIDTAYSSSRATVNVTRGSEQYRALTADEPGLRSVAEQLGGEVIVVWKGRAYRIH